MGLQATPVKPWPQDYRQQRISGNVNYNYDPSWLSYQQTMGANVITFGSDWSDIQAYVQAGRPEELRRIVDEIHRRNMRFVPYFGFEISNIAPEFQEHYEDVRVWPFQHVFTITPAYSATMPGQKAYAVSYHSHWADFIAEGIKRIKDEYGIDGVYLDGTASPWPDANELHGAGYTAEDGSRRPSYPIFAVRSLMKRINAIVAQEPGGTVIAHSSSSKLMPTLAFATVIMDGEHISNMPRGASPLETLSLDAFRAEFMGRTWGVPQLMLDNNPTPLTTEELLSIALLHDEIPRNDLTLQGLSTTAGYWSLFGRFIGRDEAVWFPYWRNQDYVTTSHSDIKVSFYQRAGKGLLIVVSNLGDKDLEEAWVTVDLAKLGLTGPGPEEATLYKPVQRRFLGQEPIVIESGRIALSLPKWTPHVIWALDASGQEEEIE